MNAALELPPALAGRKGGTPTLPPGAPALLRALNDDNIGLADLGALIERFPPVAARLIGLANSAWSAPASPVVSVTQACSRIGLDVIRGIALGMTVALPFNPKRCAGFDSERFWVSAMLSADIAPRLAEASGAWSGLDVHAARTAGLLHNLGLQWLADRMPAETNAAIAAITGWEADSGQAQPTLDQSTHSQCGIGYARAGAHLCRQWQLPPVLVCAVEHQAERDYRGDGWQAAMLIRMAADIANGVFRQVPVATCADLPISADIQRAISQRAAARLDDTRAMVRALFPG